MNDAKIQARTFSSLQNLRLCKHGSAPETNVGHHNPKSFKK